MTLASPDKAPAPSMAESTISGRAEAAQTVKVVSKLAGKISDVYVDMGSAVNQYRSFLAYR